jgi:hypothetical protein
MKGSRLSEYSTLKLAAKDWLLTKLLIWRETEEEER